MYNKIREDIKTVMRSGDKEVLAILRWIDSKIQGNAKTRKKEIDDRLVEGVINTDIKKRMGLIDIYTKNGNDQIVNEEQFAIDVLKNYLPEPMDKADILELIGEKIVEACATSIRDMGKVMKLLKNTPGLDRAYASEMVKKTLIEYGSK